MDEIRLSRLDHTWLIDIDGTVLAHNGHLTGQDELLPGVRAFWAQIPPGDRIVLLSARKAEERVQTLASFHSAGLRFDDALFGLPTGERILINDTKPAGLVTALAMPVSRDGGLAHLNVVFLTDR